MKTKKHKDSKQLRWELVHAAGCTEERCATKWVTEVSAFIEYVLDYNLTKPVSVPKSLRHLLGRYITQEK
jgi:hypothetical protein